MRVNREWLYRDVSLLWVLGLPDSQTPSWHSEELGEICMQMSVCVCVHAVKCLNGGLREKRAQNKRKGGSIIGFGRIRRHNDKALIEEWTPGGRGPIGEQEAVFHSLWLAEQGGCRSPGSTVNLRAYLPPFLEDGRREGGVLEEMWPQLWGN